MLADGTDVHQLATTKGDITDIAWSPDGGRIRLTFDDAIWEITSTGENLHPVLPDWKGPPGQCCGRWTPDGAFYLFFAGGNNYAGPTVGGYQQIWVLDERRGLFRRTSRKPVQLTSGPVRWDTLVPSRDGEKIFAKGTTPRGELVRLDSKSNEFQPFLGGISAESLSFSRDGSQIAYVTYPDGILWRAKADGTERVQLTSPSLYPMLCHWSPDGTRLLFTAARGASRYAIYTVAAQGGSPQPLIPVDDGMGQVDGNWSPDGRRIVYHVDPHAVYIFDIGTGRATKIPGGDGLWSPRWSPDGRYIAAMTTESAVTIKLFDLQAHRWSSLTESTGPWGYPTWSRNSKFIYALNLRGKRSVQRISVPDGRVSPVADLSNVHLIGATVDWFGLDPSDVPLTLRNNGTSDIYALTLERK
jgi:Tol biopolymer transport system component